ncbi:MAG TPA: EAL domain-containing protein [Oxalicibacterium sp.]|jgi:diguanylate cyclase (GGDEF)-like protein/PAS domain S-box-containing protein|nr:EAL domain-containing protein [Oxalicibacterium sp.]
MRLLRFRQLDVVTGSEIFRVVSLLLFGTLLFHIGLLLYATELTLSSSGLVALAALIILFFVSVVRCLWPRHMVLGDKTLLGEMVIATVCIVTLSLHKSMPNLPIPWLIAVAGVYPLMLPRVTAGVMITIVAIIGYWLNTHLHVRIGGWLPDLFATLCIGGLAVFLSRILMVNRAAIHRARTNERRFNAIARVTRHVFIITDSGYQMKYANPALQEVIGYSYEEVVDNGIKPVLHPEDEEEHKRKLRYLRDTPHSTIFSRHRTRHKDGHWVWLETHGYNMLHDSAINGLVFSLEDITLRKDAELKLQEETALLRSVLDLNPTMIYAKDTEGRYTISNLSFQKLFGYSSEDELRGKTAYELLASREQEGDQRSALEVAAEIEAQDRHIIDTGAPLQNLELKGFWRNDLDRWYRTDKYPLRDTQGRIIGVLGITRDVTERKHYETRIEYQTMHDSLTSLPNRRFLVKKMATAIEESRQRQASLTLLFCDLDFFKSVNDTHGHDFGDKCLVETARRIVAAVAPDDFVARFGGNEFVVLTNASLAEATVKADAIMYAVSQPLVFNDVVVKLQTSIGIAQLSSDHRTPAELIQDADAAMYQAKERGRNRAAIYDAALQSQSTRQARMDVALRFALERNEFSVAYQPKIMLADGTLKGFELLLRWNSPEYGLVSPNEFIPIAETSGLVVPIGMWAMEQACRQLAQWQSTYAGIGHISVAVNVSMRQLLQASFLPEVRRILDSSGVIPQTLELELTETSAMANPLQTIENLAMLKKLGLCLALDDFGTGYSSLAYLQKLPIDILKIDKTFVHGLGTDKNDMQIIRLIMALAQALNLETIAEGVETSEHIEELRKIGCHIGQGYFFSAPLTAEEATRLVASPRKFAL